MNLSNQSNTVFIPYGLAVIAAGRDILSTEEAAFVLNRKCQTLRVWAMGKGRIQPVRINGRLGWKVSDIARLLNGEAA